METEIGLRKAKSSDCEYVYKLICLLEKSSFKYDDFCRNYAINLQNNDIDYYIITFENEQCGFISIHTQILLHHNGEISEIQELIIEEKYRGKRIGKNLIKMLKEIYKGKKIIQLEVCTNKNRHDTQRFYKKNEFIETHYKYVMEL